jgi:hypothetical protein
MEALALSPEARSTAGILLVAVVAVETGGIYMYRVVRRRVRLTPFQQAFARVCHAHAGVLVVLSLIVQLYADAAAAPGLLGTLARSAVPAAAILMPAGFFLSSSGEGRTEPTGLVWVLYVGAASLGIGATALGIALLIGSGG